MTHAVVGIAALVIFLMCWRKFGFRKATFWACGILLTLPAFALTGMLLPSIFKFFGVQSLSMTTRIATGLGLVVAATITAKYTGWAKVLAGVFQAAMVLSAVGVLGFLAVCFFALANGAR
jgi:hypothetical protein